MKWSLCRYERNDQGVDIHEVLTPFFSLVALLLEQGFEISFVLTVEGNRAVLS